MKGIYRVSELAYENKEFSEIVELVIQHVNGSDQVLQGNEQLDTFFVILAMVEDDSDSVNEGLTFAVRGIGREGFEKDFDEKLKELAEEMVRDYEEAKI